MPSVLKKFGNKKINCHLCLPLLSLVVIPDNAYACDPRIRKFKEEAKKKKDDQKAAKAAAAKAAADEKLRVSNI